MLHWIIPKRRRAPLRIRRAKGLSPSRTEKFSLARGGRNAFRYERALIPPRVGESAAIISSDEIPERRRWRRGRGVGRHTDTRTFHFAIPTRRLLRDRDGVQLIWGAATSSTFQRRDKFRERVLHMHRTTATVNEVAPRWLRSGYVLTIATRTPTMAMAVVVPADRGEKGGEKDSKAGRPVVRSVATRGGGRGGRHCRCPTIEFTSDQPGRPVQSAMLFPNLNSSSRVSSPRERWTTTSQRLRTALCHPALSYLVF